MEQVCRVEEAHQGRQKRVGEGEEENEIDYSVGSIEVAIDSNGKNKWSNEPVRRQADKAFDEYSSLSIRLCFIPLLVAQLPNSNYVKKSLHFIPMLRRVNITDRINGIKLSPLYKPSLLNP